MIFGIPRRNQAVTWKIGEAGKPQDAYPMRIDDVQGRDVSGFVLRKNSEGETYLDHVITSRNFLDPRGELVEDLDAPSLAQLATTFLENKAARQTKAAEDAAV